MKIIEPSFEILYWPEHALELTEIAARNCYKSEEKICSGSAEKMVRHIIDSKHESVLEHCSVTVRIVCDRGVLAELTRHRIASFSVESTRYANYSKDKFGNEITVIKPLFWEESSKDYVLWLYAMESCKNVYMQLLKNGASPQEARSVLPNSLKTDIVMTANIREWIHIFDLRCSSKAHPQMREIMLPMLDEFYRRIPVVFGGVWDKYFPEDGEEKRRWGCGNIKNIGKWN